MKKVSFVLMIALAMATAPAAIAQQGQGSGSGSGQGSGQRSGNVVTTTGQQQGRATTVEAPGFAGNMTNVRLELTITDQSGTGAPIKKVISLLLAERGNGRVRSAGSVPNTSYNVTLNADAYIERIESERIRTSITVEYAPAGGTTDSPRVSTLNQSVIVALTNGKPTVLVQAADPLTDRKVTLEVTATILR